MPCIAKALLDTGLTEDDTVIYAVKIMADSICDVLVNPRLLDSIKEEFATARGDLKDMSK